MTRLEDLARLPHAERRKLLQFVIAFAWADLTITTGELAFIRRLMDRLRLPPEEASDVAEWLNTPPPSEDVDPTTIPHGHREIFLGAVREMMSANGGASPEERESLRLLERLTL